MRNLKIHVQILAVISVLLFVGCQKTAFYSGDAPARDTSLAPFPVDTVEVPHAFKPYLAQVKAYEALDKEKPIKVGEVVLLGNSLFSNWKDVQDYFDEDIIYNRSITDIDIAAQQFYSTRLTAPYEPRQVFLYVGEQEVMEGKTALSIFNQIRPLLEELKYNLPNAEVSFVSLLKTPVNLSLHSRYDELDQLLKGYLTDKSKMSYIDVNAAFETETGDVDSKYFTEEILNELGTKKLADVLKEKLDVGKPKVSTYMEFDGTTNYVRIPHHSELDINLGESMTITFWERVSVHNGARFVTKRNGNGYEIVANGAGLLAANVRGLEGNLGTPYSSSAFTVNGNQWHHVAFVYDQTGSQKMTKVYLDGILVTESAAANIKTTDQDLSVPTADLVIGAQSDPAGTKMKGAMDNIRIYKKALSVQGIKEDMATLELKSYDDVIASYDFEDIEGNRIENKSANKHHGIAAGAIKTGQRIVQ
ncbi:LamG-like jellyroll fold domain-containing protein [Sphingobacterium paucimobilis]|uniref:LamG-like jellyroll fold domain-containing protein n=1 Tax=Sphingobacterium paucimobilis HER1398 TaxID=1346330 RepID=U2J5N2_9SPHI|nr:LamG-like jellyroll fold domain-containing protein [Sphingobacterium paucimobilis]ERJ57973.1 hypothetical protein M472_04255 [Sphingobacterium paucimobilis HER1398]